MKYRVIFFGSSHHSLPALEALANDSRYTVVAVVTQPDKPVGRKQIVTPTPVAVWANEHKVEIIPAKSWKKIDEKLGENENVHRLKELKPDFGVLVYYGRILTQDVIDVFPKGIVNTHPSLLPKYRGATPGQMAILNGETQSGVSIMLLEVGQDTGPVLAQENFDVASNEIPETYYEKGFRLGADLMMKVLPDYLEGKLQSNSQDHTQATNTPLLSRENGKIDWSLSAEEIERMVRAFTPWPGTWTEVWIDGEGQVFMPDDMAERMGFAKKDIDWNGVTKKRLKILSVALDGNRVILDDVQLEGEKVRKFSSMRI